MAAAVRKPRRREPLPPDEAPTHDLCPLCEGKGSVEPVCAELFRETCRQVKEIA